MKGNLSYRRVSLNIFHIQTFTSKNIMMLINQMKFLNQLDNKKPKLYLKPIKKDR